MKLLLGPILYLGRCDGADWNFRVGLLSEPTASDKSPFHLDVPGSPEMGSLSGTLVDRLSDARGAIGDFWMYHLTFSRDAFERRVTYRVLHTADGSVAFNVSDVVIPGLGDYPRLAFFSCNGFSSASDANKAARMGGPSSAYSNWTKLLERHRKTPFHLAIGGGDQIYADALLDDRSFWDFGEDERLNLRVALGARDGNYFRLYIDQWSRNKPFLEALRCIPLVATWDDHDIFDGWGSWDKRHQACDLFKALFHGAARAFDLLQCGHKAGLGAPFANPHWTRFGIHRLQHLPITVAGERGLDIILLDTRTLRTQEAILGDQQWLDLKALFASLSASPIPRHVMVIAPVPVIYLEFHVAEFIGSATGMDDDIRDHWQHRSHRGERSQLIMNLLELARDANACVTILSGDVHVGAQATIETTRLDLIPAYSAAKGLSSIKQITSSGIVHPPPNWMELRVIGALTTEHDERFESGISIRLNSIGGSAVWRDRNWLAIDPDQKKNGIYICTWMAEHYPVSEKVFLKTS